MYTVLLHFAVSLSSKRWQLPLSTASVDAADVVGQTDP